MNHFFFQWPVKSRARQCLQKGLGLHPDVFVVFRMTAKYVTRLEAQTTAAVLALKLFWCNWSCLTIHQIQILLNLFSFSLLIKEIIPEVLSSEKVGL